MEIVYFDGHCNVCNRFVDFLLKHDRRKTSKFAPLQGSTAAQRLPPDLTTNLSTMVYEDDQQRLFTESTAAIKTMVALGGWFRVFKLFLFLPRGLRDGVYRAVADHRYLLAGRRATCRLPTAEERSRFLD